MTAPLPATPTQPNLAPVQSVYTPNTAAPSALQGGTIATDTLGQAYAPVVAQLVAGGAVIGHVIVDSGALTANAGTNLNTSALALEAGGNLAGAKTDLDTIVTNTNKIPVLGQATKSASVPITIASDQGDIPVKGDFMEMASLSAGSLNADLVASTDVSAYKWLSLHINTNAYSGTLSFQASNDNVNWVTANLFGGGTLNSAVNTTSSTNALYIGPVSYRYFRVRMTSYTSGTAQGTLELYTSIGYYIFNSLSTSQSGTWTVQPGNTANTTPWLVNANAGTNLNTSALALETGGNLAGAKTDLDTISTNLNQLAVSDSLTIASIPVFIPGMSNGSTGAERIHSIDGLTDSNTFGAVAMGPWLFNGTNWDRQRNNQDNIVVLASAARTTTQTQGDQVNYNHRGIMVVLDMTVVGTGSVTLEIDAKDPVSGKYIALLTGAAVAGNSTNIYTIYPGNTVAANVSASTVLPRTWRIKVTANNANSATYSVGAMLLL